MLEDQGTTAVGNDGNDRDDILAVFKTSQETTQLAEATFLTLILDLKTNLDLQSHDDGCEIDQVVVTQHRLRRFGGNSLDLQPSKLPPSRVWPAAAAQGCRARTRCSWR